MDATSQVKLEQIFDQFTNKKRPLVDREPYEEALAAYEQAIRLAPRAAILHYHKGHVLEQMGRLAEAKQAYEEARNLGYSNPGSEQIL